jgi:hypothetical protein
MINERLFVQARRTARLQKVVVQGYQRFPPVPIAEDAMTSVLAAFVVAVGGTSLIYYVVAKWGQNRKVGRESAGSDDLSFNPVVSSSGESLNLLSWFGSDSASSDGSGCSSGNSSSDSSACSSDSSGGDSGGDGGGGGGD